MLIAAPTRSADCRELSAQIYDHSQDANSDQLIPCQQNLQHNFMLYKLANA